LTSSCDLCFGSFVLILLVILYGCTDESQMHASAEAEQRAGRLEEADAHFEAGRFDQSLRLYETFLEGDADEVPYGRLQRTYLALGLTKRAHALEMRRRTAGMAEPWPGSWHCDMGMIAIQAGDKDALFVHTDSLSQLAASLQPQPDPRTIECLAFHEVFASRFSEAQDHLELLARTDNYGAPPPNLAFLYLRKGRVEHANLILSNAERGAAKAAAADPDDPEPHFELAEFATMRGDVPTAVAALADAMDRGLGRTWWIYQLFDPDSIPDPVFEPLYGNPDFERMRASVVEERTRMLSEGEDSSRTSGSSQ
jgi:tetratricopeptide (TPR) repeat protein